MKRIVFVVSAIVYIFICLYFVFTIVTNVNIGISVEQLENETWVVSNIKNNGWGKYNDIQVGQQIVTVDSTPVEDHFAVKMYGVIGKVKEMEIVEDGEIKKLQITNNFRESFLYFHLIFSFIFISFASFISYHLIFKYKSNQTKTILIIFLNLYGISFLAALAAIRADVIGQFFVYTNLVLVPTLFLHFLHHYLMEKYDILLVKRFVIVSLYAICSIVFLLNLLLVIFSLGHYFDLLYLFTLICFAIIIIVNIYSLIVFYIKIRQTTISPTFKIIFVAIIASFAPFILANIVPILIFNEPFVIGEITSVFSYILPVVLCYLIMTDRIIDIDFFIRKIYIYIYLSVLFVILLIGLLSIFTQYTLFEYAQLFFILLFVTIVFLYVRDWMAHKFRHKLFPQKNELQIRAQDFVRFMSKIMKRSEFEERLIQEIKAVLYVKTVAIISFPKNDDDVSLKENLEIEIYQKIKANIYEVAKIYRTESGYFSVISENENDVYVLAIGEKKNHVKFNDDEINWLTTMSYLTYITYENLQHIDDLFNQIQMLENKNKKEPWLTRLLFQIQETERRKLANDLHDSILQELLVLHQKIESLLTDKVDVEKKVIELKEGFLDVIYDLRETCIELRPPFLLEFGLIKAVNDLIEKIQLRTNFVVEFHYEKLSIELDDECTVHLYRIIQELLNNASKHSRASKVMINLGNDDENVYLNYEDDGSEMNKLMFHSTANHFGLSGIKERVYSLEGTIEMNVDDEKGFMIHIRIPIMN